MPRNWQKFAADRRSGSPVQRGLRIVIRIASWPSRSYWLETVRESIRKSRLAWCFGMPQMPLPPLTEISVLTGRSYTYWPTS